MERAERRQRHAKAKAYVYMLYCFSTQILKEHEAEAKKCPTEGADGNGGDALFTWSARVVLHAAGPCRIVTDILESW